MHTSFAVYETRSEGNLEYVVRPYQVAGYALHRQVPGTWSATRKGADSTCRSLASLMPYPMVRRVQQ